MTDSEYSLAISRARSSGRPEAALRKADSNLLALSRALTLRVSHILKKEREALPRNPAR